MNNNALDDLIQRKAGHRMKHANHAAVTATENVTPFPKAISPNVAKKTGFAVEVNAFGN